MPKDLGQMDHASVRNLLGSWEVEDDDPLWNVRRAALSIEIGEVRLARTMADDALAEVRKKLQPGVDDFASCSREGLAMNLIHARRLLPPNNPPVAPDEFTGRWDKLIRCHCNPNVEAETLRTYLALAVSRKDFSTILSFKDGDIAYDPPPAFQAIRFVEEAAYPIRYGQHTNEDAPRLIEGAAHSHTAPGIICGAKISSASPSNRLCRLSPSMPQGYSFALPYQEGIKRQFADHQVAVLETSTVRRIYGFANQALSHFCLGSLRTRFHHQPRAEKRSLPIKSGRAWS